MKNSIEWIKISTKIFANRKIKFILSNKKGDKFFKIFIQLLTLAGTINDKGNIYISKNVFYTHESLAAEIGEPTKVISEALELFETLEMISVSDGLITIRSWDEHQNVEGMERVREQNRIRKQRQREREKESVTNDETVTGLSRDITQQNKNKNKNIDNIYSYHHNNIVNIERDERDENDDEDDYAWLNSKDNPFHLWEHYGFGALNKGYAEMLKMLIEETSESIVCDAMKIAARHNARNFAYVEKVAQRIAAGDNSKPADNGNGDGFSGFGAIMEGLLREDEK